MHPGAEPAPDDYLVQQAQEGYLDAYELLVQRHGPQAFRLAYHLVDDAEAAKDVTQESLVSAWRGLARFRGNAEFSTWLFRIVTNTSLTHLAKRGRSTASLDAAHAVASADRGPAENALDRERTAAVRAALAALPSTQRVPLILQEYHGLSYEQIAQVTDTSVAAVKNQLYRARAVLRRTLQEWR